MTSLVVRDTLPAQGRREGGWLSSITPGSLLAMRGGYVYIMTNGPSGTLYVGVTSNLAARAFQHRSGAGSDFCRKHGLTMLVYIERHERIDEAIAREKAIKRWKRAWKLNLIGRANPDWRDLYDELNA